MNPPEELKLFKEKEPQFKIKATGEIVTLDWIQKIVALYQSRLKTLSEIRELTDFFFKEKLEYDKNLLKWAKMSEKDIIRSLERSEKVLSKIKKESWTKENLKKVLIDEAEKFAKEIGKIGDRGYLLWPLRVALTGKEASAPPFEIAEILGKEKTLKRIKEAKKLL